jgi:hypothetical protein
MGSQPEKYAAEKGVVTSVVMSELALSSGNDLAKWKPLVGEVVLFFLYASTSLLTN